MVGSPSGREDRPTGLTAGSARPCNTTAAAAATTTPITMAGTTERTDTGGTTSSMDVIDAATDHIVARMLGESKEYGMIVKGLAVLEEQLRRAQQDIATLQELKRQALAAPEAFIERLTRRRTMASMIRQCQEPERPNTNDESLLCSTEEDTTPALPELPRLQRVALLPNINLCPWLGRLPRRATTKYDQNLEFLLLKLGDMQARRPAPATDKLVLSSLLPLSSSSSSSLFALASCGGGEVAATTLGAGSSATTVGDGPVFLATERVRRKFIEIAGSWRSASAPALLLVPPASSMPYAATDRSSLFSPQPLKAQSIQFSLPFAPASAVAASSTDVSPVKRTRSSLGGASASSMISSAGIGTGSASSSPLASNAPSVAKTSTSNSTPSPSSASGSGERKRRKKLTTPEESPHHNLPWTEEERRRLDELMAIYPEEQISTRRYAKIAAALSTRTAAQVANRINKLLHKRRRHGATPMVTMDVETVADAQLRATKEWHQYEMLKKQISMLEANPEMTVHAGFCCDRCGMDPILGVRWRCTRCVEPDAVDLCVTCYEQRGTFATATHRSDHRFLPHRE